MLIFGKGGTLAFKSALRIWNQTTDF